MTDKKLMPPLWLAYPYISRYSIGWRMGSGESYKYKFWDWFDNELSKSEQAEYKEMFPAPKRWYGFWEEDEESEADETNDMEFFQNDLFMNFWQKDGNSLFDLEWLKGRCNRGEKPEYLFFWGHRPSPNGITKSCLSQWWKSDFSEDIEGYCCMEQYMMASKAKLFGDEEICKKIMNSSEPKTIKSLGRKIRGFDEEVWNKAKHSIVINGNYLKFSQNRQLMNFLLQTGDKVLVEASPYDGIWGIQMSVNDERAQDPFKWQGSNLLGFALMEVREELRRVYKNEQLLDYGFID